MAALRVRKLLNITAAAAKKTVEDRRITALNQCSEEMVMLSQGNEGPMHNGIPSYSVTIIYTCLECTVRDVHVACGEFASTEMINPSDFRRLAVGDCLVKDGGTIGPGEVIAFEYCNSFMYDLHVASVCCG